MFERRIWNVGNLAPTAFRLHPLFSCLLLQHGLTAKRRLTCRGKISGCRYFTHDTGFFNWGDCLSRWVSTLPRRDDGGPVAIDFDEWMSGLQTYLRQNSFQHANYKTEFEPLHNLNFKQYLKYLPHRNWCQPSRRAPEGRALLEQSWTCWNFVLLCQFKLQQMCFLVCL